MTGDPNSTKEVAECPSCSNAAPIPKRMGLSGRPAEHVPILPSEVLDMEVKFLCGCCKNRLRADSRLEGRKVPCPVCSEETSVPRWSGARVIPVEVLELGVKFICNSCESRIRADARLEGRIVGCPVCSEKVEVPHWSGLPEWSGAAGRNVSRPFRPGGKLAEVLLTTEEIDYLSKIPPAPSGTVS